ncbi:MAG: cobalt-precorrin-5B (C(1))-methyltransferase [Methanomicrobiales archaeon]|nr:cobalt-precorrin-5B (C(1))-methyltransferase [Methanomicrobiales archaeon]
MKASPDEAAGSERLVDPVTGFVYPQEWSARCRDPQDLTLARRGLGVLTASGKVLRRGFSTGTTAAAACKAAILSLEMAVAEVEVLIPCGMRVKVSASGNAGVGCCSKYPGDYPEDATAWVEFIARTERSDEGTALIAGEGIGRFERSTSRFRRGDPAISPTSYRCIMHACQEALGDIGARGVRIELSVPHGEEIAETTLNRRMGIAGGISVLGSTGLVEPWGGHLLDSVLERVEKAKRPVLTTGRTGMRYASMLFPDREVILVGAKIGEALGRCKGDAILFGLPGLIMRFIDPRILEGTGFWSVEELIDSGEYGSRIPEALGRFKRDLPWVRVILVDREGRILVDSG